MDDPLALPLLAYFFSLLLMMQQVDQDVPIVAGPYFEYDQCESVREYLDHRGYETDACALMSISTPARKLEVIDIP